VTERKHEYRPLSPNEIRLLALNPGLPDEPIECFLEHHSANQAKPYDALSYPVRPLVAVRLYLANHPFSSHVLALMQQNPRSNIVAE
jgi:hypothetical protein